MADQTVDVLKLRFAGFGSRLGAHADVAGGAAAVHGHTVEVDNLADEVDIGVAAEVVDAAQLAAAIHVGHIGRGTKPLVVDRTVDLARLICMALDAGGAAFIGVKAAGVRGCQPQTHERQEDAVCVRLPCRDLCGIRRRGWPVARLAQGAAATDQHKGQQADQTDDKLPGQV